MTEAASSLCVHRDGKVEYLLYYGGQWNNWSWNGSEKKIEEPNLWLERGHLELPPNDHMIGVLREGARPTQLFLNGHQSGIFDHPGRVFVIIDSQKFQQVALQTSVIKTEADLKRFSAELSGQDIPRTGQPPTPMTNTRGIPANSQRGR